ncbi:hypothetical protein D3C77_601960 [compost metagenome]
MMHARLVMRGWATEPARPGGNAALGIAGALGAQRREIVSQARGLSRADLGLGVHHATSHQQYYHGFQHS